MRPDVVGLTTLANEERERAGPRWDLPPPQVFGAPGQRALPSRRPARDYVLRIPSQPARNFGRRMNGAASGAFFAVIVFQSHSSFLPVR